MSVLSHYVKVAGVVGREVVKREHLYPPDVSKFGQASQEFGSAVINILTTNPAKFTVMQLARGGLLVGEVFGFYYVGEVIGKRRLVGYPH